MKKIIGTLAVLLFSLGMIKTTFAADDISTQSNQTLNQPTMSGDNQTNMADQNKKEGEDFLAQNKTKPGVKTTDTGLQYQVIKEGQGTSPSDSDTVTVHYAGRTIDGKEFDSSYKRGEPASFGVTQVIPGWTEVLKLMKPGDVWEVYIPSDLAYGARGAGADIGPNKTLIFKIELLKVNKNS